MFSDAHSSARAGSVLDRRPRVGPPGAGVSARYRVPVDLPTRMALLRHVVADDAWHYDWLIEPAPGGRLITFRVHEPIHEAGGHAFDGERIGEHRRVYLDYEGPLSGDRGSVERVAVGRCRVERDSPDLLDLWADWGRGAARLVGSPRAGGADWSFRTAADERAPADDR